MNGLRVAELAVRAGVAASTVRFYERAGLLSPARRAVNGYRIFDESALDELAFIQRAKAMGISLEDIAGLVAVWPSGSCQSLQAQMRVHLAGQITTSVSSGPGWMRSSTSSRQSWAVCQHATPAQNNADGDAAARPTLNLIPMRPLPAPSLGAARWAPTLWLPGSANSRGGRRSGLGRRPAGRSGSPCLWILTSSPPWRGCAWQRPLAAPAPVPAGGHRRPGLLTIEAPRGDRAAADAAPRQSTDPPIVPPLLFWLS